MKNVTEMVITELEQLMKSFPDLLKAYTEANNILLAKVDELRIYGCFQDAAMNDSIENFGNFTFRHGDKILLLRAAKLTRAKENCEASEQNGDANVEADYSLFKFCNLNAEFPSVSTVVGMFYGAEETVTYRESIAAVKGIPAFLVNYFLFAILNST